MYLFFSNNYHPSFISKVCPPSIKVSTYAYVSGLLSYNIATAYRDSKSALELYNSKKYPTYEDKYNGEFNANHYILEKYYRELKICNNDWEAAKLGASYFKWERLWNSIVFPINVVSDIIPSIVVSLHGKKD